MTLLNRGPRAPVLASDLRSRGTIIPALLHLSRIDQVVEAARHLEGPFEPFTLVVLRGAQVVTLTNTNAGASTQTFDLAAPLLFTSSSLGDDLVEAPRRALFNRLVRANPTSLAVQERFHRHAWKARPEISVRMSRADALTVSRTVIDIADGTARLRYTPLDTARRRGSRDVQLTLSIDQLP
jgi:hypothetical protein